MRTRYDEEGDSWLICPLCGEEVESAKFAQHQRTKKCERGRRLRVAKKRGLVELWNHYAKKLQQEGVPVEVVQPAHKNRDAKKCFAPRWAKAIISMDMPNSKSYAKRLALKDALDNAEFQDEIEGAARLAGETGVKNLLLSIYVRRVEQEHTVCESAAGSTASCQLAEDCPKPWSLY